MRPSICAETHGRHQRGEALLESLIGVLLMTALGLGLTYAASRALIGQRNLNTQAAAVGQMREVLQNAGVRALCSGTAGSQTITVAGQSIAVTPTCQVPTLSVNYGGAYAKSIAASAPLNTVTLATPNNATTTSVFGGPGAISVSK